MGIFTMPAVVVARKKIRWPDANGYIYNESEHEGMWVEGYSLNDGSQSKQSDHLYIYASQDGARAQRTYVTDEAISLDGYASLKIEWENTGSTPSYNRSYIIASTEKNGDHEEFNKRLERAHDFSKSVSTVDISALSGSYYVRIHAVDHREDGTPRPSEILAYNVWLEE